MVLIDTDVLVDCLRGVNAATHWLGRESAGTFAIPGVVAMGLLMGCRNAVDLHLTQELLSRFEVIWPEASEFAHAYELLTNHRLTSGLGIPDCLIAATALARRARLYTFNLKHFRLISGLDAQQPYLRP